MRRSVRRNDVGVSGRGECIGSGRTGVGIKACIVGSISGYDRIGGDLDSSGWIGKPGSEGVTGSGDGRESSEWRVVGDRFGGRTRSVSSVWVESNRKVVRGTGVGSAVPGVVGVTDWSIGHFGGVCRNNSGITSPDGSEGLYSVGDSDSG